MSLLSTTDNMYSHVKCALNKKKIKIKYIFLKTTTKQLMFVVVSLAITYIVYNSH